MLSNPFAHFSYRHDNSKTLTLYATQPKFDQQRENFSRAYITIFISEMTMTVATAHSKIDLIFTHFSQWIHFQPYIL